VPVAQYGGLKKFPPRISFSRREDPDRFSGIYQAPASCSLKSALPFDLNREFQARQ
jgi:hypothetical protein